MRGLRTYVPRPPAARSAPDLYRNWPTAPRTEARRKQKTEGAGVFMRCRARTGWCSRGHSRPWPVAPPIEKMIVPIDFRFRLGSDGAGARSGRGAPSAREQQTRILVFQQLARLPFED